MKIAQKLAINIVRARIHALALVSNKAAARYAFRLFCTPFKAKHSPKATIFNQAEEIPLQVNGKQIMAYRWNSTGPFKIMIAHGFHSRASNFHRYIGYLVKKGYQVLAIDAPAHGKSEGKQTNVLEYVDALAVAKQTFGDFQAIMGHSFGGLAVSLFVDQWQPKQTVQMVLLAPATETTTAFQFYFNLMQVPKTVQDLIVDYTVKLAGRSIEDLSVARVMPTLNASVLWAHDKEDDITPFSDVSPVIAQSLPNVNFMVTEGLGHRRIYRENHVFKAVIAHLTGQ